MLQLLFNTQPDTVARDHYFYHIIVLVAEVTQPSLGVGYELGRAVAMKKRILCLFRPETGRSME